ncbi:MAG: hydrogenase formation protein HypD [Planctomycetota bacterium]|nr:MAG: hydrogenase formation protein HypD [Planctomycetota bacterium]
MTARTPARRCIEEIRSLAEKIPSPPLRLMEVCGTHTVSIARNGIRDILPENISLLSGPGCPVCVTPDGVIDAAISLAEDPRVIIATFGDMMKVPGTEKSLERARAEGADVRMVYSPTDALRFAREYPDRKVVFIAVGFETTQPGNALTIERARADGLKNFFVIPAGKLIPPAMAALLEDSDSRIGGFICPGHVSVIIGADAYAPIVEKYGKPCVVAGFEPEEILEGIAMFLGMAVEERPEVVIQYRQCVDRAGNLRAREILNRVYHPADSEWRGLGVIPESGFELNDEYADYDAFRHFGIEPRPSRERKGCRCGEVLQGKVEPFECALFSRACTPEHAVGPCMVSSEGTCGAYYRYNRKKM